MGLLADQSVAWCPDSIDTGRLKISGMCVCMGIDNGRP